MVVGSGQAPYNYVGPKKQFRVQGQKVAPSAVLYEEAMFALKAEYNRLRTVSSGFIPTNRDMSLEFDPTVPDDSFKFVLNSGTFVKYINRGLSGLFDPDPSGRYLDGRFACPSGTASGLFDVPGMFYSRDYIVDMREVLISIFHAIANKIGDQEDLDVSGLVATWLGSYKNYYDGAAQSGFFYEESGVLEQLEVGSDFLTSHRSGVIDTDMCISGLFDRHIDEVRYQPMPFVLGNSGTVLDSTPWNGSNLHPIKPIYWRTDGSVASGWVSVTLYGDTLVDGMWLVLSGYNNSSNNRVYAISGWTPITDSTFPSNPRSGTFSPISMASGWYKLILGASGANNNIDVLFPWGTGLTTNSTAATWPRSRHWFGNNNGSYGIIVTDDIFAMQDHEPEASRTAFSPAFTESGLIWNGVSPLNSRKAIIADFVRVNPQSSGVGDGLWGHDLRTKWGSNSATKVRSGGWMYHRANDRIYRVLSSGGNTEWPTASFHPGYPAGTGVITVWTPRLLEIQSVNTVGTVVGADTQTYRAYGLETITFDGSDFICAGHINRDGVTTTSNSGSYLKIDTSFNLVDSIPLPVASSFRLHYARNRGEFLGLTTADLEGLPGLGSGGYKLVNLTWGGITTAGGGSQSVTGYFATFSSSVSGYFNLIGDGPKDRTPRIIDFIDQEDTDDLYCIFWAYPSGQPSGIGDTWRRYLGKIDDTSHPFVITEIWEYGNDSTRDSLGTSIRNAEYGMFADNWLY